MFFTSVCAVLTGAALFISNRKATLAFKLLSYDYLPDKDKGFYGSDEMIDAYNKQLGNKKLEDLHL